MHQPFVIGVGGFTSSVGKTTLMCELLTAFPGWEAIKTTRGHYRSCGKDANACCVSHLLSAEPLVRSGREETYEVGKDTGRYWDAGASNVHWLIAMNNQVEKGIKQALERTRSEGVFIEGNSFSQFIRTDYFLMVRRSDRDDIKSSAKKILHNVSAIYLSDTTGVHAKMEDETTQAVALRRAPVADVSPQVFTSRELPLLIGQLQAIIPRQRRLMERAP